MEHCVVDVHVESTGDRGAGPHFLLARRKPLNTPPADHTDESELRSVVELTRSLVQAPSRGGVDDPSPVIDVVTRWLDEAEVDHCVLRPDRADGAAGVLIQVAGDQVGPHYMLDACLDTAGFGDEDTWSLPPTSGALLDGWLYGRGSSDSKVAVAMFAHLAARFARIPFAGRLSVLFDLDEHTGGFRGIKEFLADPRSESLAGVYIGYPGPDKIITGGRGFFRARAVVHGVAAHTGSSRSEGASNAVDRVAEFVRQITSTPLPAPPATATFPLPPRVSVTALRSGEPGNFSVVPDRAEVEIDIRLTPAFDAAAAYQMLRRLARELDLRSPVGRPTLIEPAMPSWPAYQWPGDHPLPAALLASARAAGLDPLLHVAGPSNIGNLLAARNIPATAGFGVAYRNLHGTDEAIEIATIPKIQSIYEGALRRLFALPS
jgi:succinyl-diaminopimelate desuccinylase